MKRLVLIGFSLLSAVLNTAHADMISAVSYSMLNGNQGSKTYFDDDYTGSGDTSVANALLSGGLGKLTDGVIADEIWCNTESSGTCNALGDDINGQYVGWVNMNPVITFSFAPGTEINRMYIYADDSEYSPATRTVTEGAFGYGGLSAPESVMVSELSQTFGLGNVANAGPNTYVIDFDTLMTDTLTLQFNRSTQWIFISEIQFENTAAAQDVNTPSTVVMMFAGLLVLMRARRK